MSFIEVCAGAGGLSSGFIDAGWTPILLNDFNKRCCETLKKNHPDILVLQKDIQELDLSEYRDKVDLLCGGIPCQSYSSIGLKKGLEDPRGALIYEFNRLLLQVRPKIFLIENVKNLLHHNKGSSIKVILDLLRNDNLYDITYRVLNSKDYEVPQKRERIFIIGSLKPISLFQWPEPIAKQLYLKDVLYDVPASKGQTYSKMKKEVMSKIPSGSNWKCLSVPEQKSYMRNLYGRGSLNGVCRRLSMDEQCPTLTTGPNQKLTERAHPIENRPLTIREYSRIQSFDDSYEFVGSVSDQYKMIGNAVPVKLAYHIGLSLKEFLNKE